MKLPLGIHDSIMYRNICIVLSRCSIWPVEIGGHANEGKRSTP
jgi:hypothetical protein